MSTTEHTATADQLAASLRHTGLVLGAIAHTAGTPELYTDREARRG